MVVVESTILLILCIVLFLLSLWLYVNRSRNTVEVVPFDNIRDIWTTIIRILKSEKKYKQFATYLENNVNIHETTHGTATTTGYDNIHICTSNFKQNVDSFVYVILHEITHIYLKTTEHHSIFFNQLDEFVHIVEKYYDFIKEKSEGSICGKTFPIGL